MKRERHLLTVRFKNQAERNPQIHVPLPGKLPILAADQICMFYLEQERNFSVNRELAATSQN